MGNEQYRDYLSRRAFLWHGSHGMIELYRLLCNRSGWRYLTEARGINNRCEIVGQGYTAGGEYHAFLMTPIPSGDIDCDLDVDSSDLSILCEQWLETLLADFAPDSGDKFVNFLDWAVFAEAWQGTSEPPSPNWNPRSPHGCRGRH